MMENEVELVLSNGWKMRICLAAPHTFRIRLHRTGPFTDNALLRYGILSRPSNVAAYSLREDAETVSLTNGQACFIVDRQFGQFHLLGENNEQLTRTLSPVALDESGGFDIRFPLSDEEKLYGLGDAVPDRLQLRGAKANILVAPASVSTPIPYLMSSRGWAILVNTTWPHTFDMGHTIKDQLRIFGSNGDLDFYLFVGKSLGELLDRYTDISGKPGLLPIWAYGFSYIRDILTNDREVLDDVLKFRQEDIPCDLIGLGRGWTETDQDGSTNKKWHPGRFSTPSHHNDRSFTFVDTLRRHGFKLSLLMHCSGYDLTAFEENQARQDKADGSGAATPWYTHLGAFVEDGIAAFRLSSSSQIEPRPDRFRANGMNDLELCNLYPILLGKQVYEGYVRQTGKRPFVHSVTGYTGIQRYTAMESGKYNSRGAAVLKALHMGLSGHAHTAPHINVDLREGIHSGFLQPWSFMNSGSFFRNPCVLEKSLREMFRQYARLRYRLMPYLYSAAHQAARTGMPIARAMPLLFPDDPRCEDLRQQYMLGDFLLVAVYTNEVYLPSGQWIDFWTGTRYTGPQTVTYRIPDHAGGPLFVRGGAIIPMWPDMDYIGQMPVDRMTLHIYPDSHQSEAAIHEDDGISFAYLHGEIATTLIQCQGTDSGVRIQICRRNGAYEGMPSSRGYDVYIFTGTKPAKIWINGELQRELKARNKAKRMPGWQFNRLTGMIRLFTPEAAEDAIPARIEIMLGSHDQNDRKQVTRRPSSTGVSADNPVNPEKLKKQLGLALETYRLEPIERALTAWWHECTKESDWRLSLLHGCTMLIRHAEQRGNPASEVFGSTIDAVYKLGDVSKPDDGHALLQQLVHQMIRHERDKRTIVQTIHPVVREVVAIVDLEIDRKLSLHELADRTSVHPFYLSRLFKQQIGESFSDYVRKKRMERARSLLLSGLKVYEAAAQCGYQDISHFSRVFSKYWGTSPATFKPSPS